MSYGTCESADEKVIGLDQDKRKSRGKGGLNKRTPEQNGFRPPRPHPHEGLRRAHESNPSALAAKLDKFAYIRVYLYKESHPRGRNARTLLK